MKNKYLRSFISLLTAAMLLAGCGDAANTGLSVESTISVETAEASADSREEMSAEDSGETEKVSDSSEEAAEISEESTEEAPEETAFELAVMVPSSYLMPCKTEGGVVETIYYTAYDYVGDGDPVEKKAYVYLPEGYDETKQYNVLYLMHGIGGSEDEWGLNKPSTSKLKKILDNLISNGEVEPFIVVTPNGKATAIEHETSNDLFYLFGHELRKDLIPYIESHYATYAEYDENGYDMTASRTHRAMAGLSMGGMQTINIGICECLDLFSWYGALSAAPTSYAVNKVAEVINTSEYKIDYFYNICGTEDNIAYGSSSQAAKNLPVFSEKMVDGENFTWQEKSGGHDFNIWYLGLYNFARLAFQEKEPAVPETEAVTLEIEEENTDNE